MAKAIRSNHQTYYLLTPMELIDEDRLREDSLRFYLRERLRSIDGQMAEMAAPRKRKGAKADTGLSQRQMEEILVADLWELDHLEAAREAILDTLAELGRSPWRAGQA